MSATQTSAVGKASINTLEAQRAQQVTVQAVSTQQVDMSFSNSDHQILKQYIFQNSNRIFEVY